MKILFFCASLAPGVDGVGDYTRRLAESCAARGHECLLVALNDRHITVNSREKHPDLPIQIVRYAADSDWKQRLALLEPLVASFKPDRSSWQFVPYGYHPKGLVPTPILRDVAALVPVAGRHALIHELWIGLSVGESLKNRLVGLLQRRPLLAWLESWAPQTLATTNTVYQHVLRRHGHDARILPLFGNIPINRTPIPTAPDPSCLSVIAFGTLHPQWDPLPSATFFAAAAQLQNKRLQLCLAGRSGTHATAVQTVFGRISGQAPRILGELSPSAASAAFQAADVGLAPHPWALIGKSGAAAALLEHGLPVIVPRDDWRLRTGSTPEPCKEPRLARLSDLKTTGLPAFLALRTPPRSRLDSVADAFLADSS